MIKLSYNNQGEQKHPLGFIKMGLNRREMERHCFWHNKRDQIKTVGFVSAILTVPVGLGFLLFWLLLSFAPPMPSAGLFSDSIVYFPFLLLAVLFLGAIIDSRRRSTRHWRAIGVVMTEIKDHEEREYEGVYRVVWPQGSALHIATTRKTRFDSPVVEFWNLIIPKGYELPKIPLDEESNEFFDIRRYRIRFRGVTRPETEIHVRERVDRIVDVKEVISCEGIASIFR